MEHLPTELVIQILSYMSTKELKIIGLVSSEYRSLAIPFLFRRIRPWSCNARRPSIASLITCLQNNPHLSSAVRVVDVGTVDAEILWNPQRLAENLRRIIENIARWEELILPTWSELPLAVLDDNMKLRLRRLRCDRGVGDGFHRLLDILPTFTNLVELQLPDIEEKRFKSFDPVGSSAAIWMNRLEKYRGPPYPLNYLQNGTPLYHLESTTEIPPPILQRLGGLVSQQLLSLHVHLFPDVTLSPRSHRSQDIFDEGYGRNRKIYLPPSLVLSLFPNLQYVAWFLIESKSKAGSVPVRAFNSHPTIDHSHSGSASNQVIQWQIYSKWNPFRCDTATPPPASSLVRISPSATHSTRACLDVHRRRAEGVSSISRRHFLACTE